MKFKSLLAATALATLAVTGAQAADVVMEQEPAPVIMAPSFTWNGAYIGGQIGYGWGKSAHDFSDFGVDLKPDGFLGGLYAGYNFDVGNNVILGIDADATYNNLKDSGRFDLGDQDFVDAETRLRWSGAVRARAGYAFDRVLPYIAGGVAFGNIRHTLSDGVDSISESKTHTGWTLGAGVDYAATDNVILRLEYRYTDYGNKDFDVGLSGYNVDLKTHDIRLGVAYKF